MEYKTAQNTISQLARYVKYLSVLVIILLACNFSLSFLLWHQSGQEKTVLVPFNLSKTSAVGDGEVDASYLLQCASSFISFRLNVNPEVVDGYNATILARVQPKYYSDFKESLKKEADLIKAQKISSAFYTSSIKVNPENLVVIVTGTLVRHVGERKLADAKKTYELHFSLDGNMLLLTTFQEIKLNQQNQQK